MSKSSFAQYYETLTDDELEQVLADKKDLLPDAQDALSSEVQRRHIKSHPGVEPVRTGHFSGEIRCLEDDYGYQRLFKQKLFMDRYWYLLALVPLIGLVYPERYAYKDPQSVRSIIGLIFLDVVYWLFLKGRYAAYACPNCGQRFGSGSECYRCGLPRNSARHG